MNATLSSIGVPCVLTLALVTIRSADAYTTCSGDVYTGTEYYREYTIYQNECDGGAQGLHFIGATVSDIGGWYISVSQFNDRDRCEKLGERNVVVEVDFDPGGFVAQYGSVKLKNKYWLEPTGWTTKQHLQSTQWDCILLRGLQDAFADHSSAFDAENEEFLFDNTDDTDSLYVADFKFTRSDSFHAEDIDAVISWEGILTHADFTAGWLGPESSLTPLDVAGEGRYVYFMLEVTDPNNPPEYPKVFTLYGRYDTEPVPVPTLFEWGLIVMTILVLTAGTIVFGRRRAAA